MAASLFFRAPLQAVAGTTAAAYTVAGDFATTGRVVVEVDGTKPERLALQPVFPGKLTFKPAAGQTIPADPSQTGAAVPKGDLFLELTEPADLKALAKAAPSLAYPFLFAYLGVSLAPGFFKDTVLKGTVQDPLGKLGRTRTSAAVANAFARGEMSVLLRPTKTSAVYSFPSLAADPATHKASATFAVGVRTVYDPFATLPSLPSLAAGAVLAAPEFVPIPVPFFYRFLRHLATWSTLAATGHASHPLFAAFDALEDDAALGRWRRLRLFLPGKRSNTSIAVMALGDLSARAVDSAGAELWKRPANRLGEVFVQRPDGESFRLEVSGPGGAAVPVAANVGDAGAAQLARQWTAPAAGKEPAGIDATVFPALDGDPLTTNPLVPLEQGAKDLLGLTVDPKRKRVLAEKQLVKPLQVALAGFGFGVTSEPSGVYDLPTRHAVREFQREARLTDRVSGGAAVDPATVTLFAGAITGAADAATLQEMLAWRTNAYRAPDTFHVTLSGGRRIDDVGYSSAAIKGGRVFANGATRFGTIPNSNPGGLFNTTGVLLEAVLNDPALAASFPGATWEKRAICEVVHNEARVFEALNTWDDSFISVGLFQWTFGRANSTGELAGLLSTLDPADQARLFGVWDLAPSGVTGTLGTSLLYGRFKLDGTVANRDLKDEFRGFRWAYRFFEACQDTAFRREQYEHARGRLGIVLNLRLTYDGQRITAGQLLQSEVLRAQALDQHVNRPAQVRDALQACADALAQPSRIAEDNPPPNYVQLFDYASSATWVGEIYRNKLLARERQLRRRLKRKPTAAELDAEAAAVRTEMPPIETELNALRLQADMATLTGAPDRDAASGDLVLSQAQHDALAAMYRWRRENTGTMTSPSDRWDSIQTGGNAGALGRPSTTPNTFTP